MSHIARYMYKGRLPIRRYASHSPAQPASAAPGLRSNNNPINNINIKGEMMVFLNQHAELLTAVINMRVTSTEKNQLKEDAAHAGLSLSELIRRRALGRRVIANADAVVLRELRRQGGLLKHIHNQSTGAYSSETAAALYALKNYFETLTHDCKTN